MPNEIISAETREADAQWCENRAILYRAEVRYAAYPEERPIREARVAIYSRLAELSRAAAKQDAAIAKLKDAIAAYDERFADGAWIPKSPLVELLAAAREVVGGGA